MKTGTIVILTGAGISAESGVSTFRDNNGLWCNHRIEDVATPEGFMRNPALVQQFYNQRRAQLAEVKPNLAHEALAELAEKWPGRFLLITQNVDDLHDRALLGRCITPSPQPSPRRGEGGEQSERARGHFELIHLHGELGKVRCTDTGSIFDWTGDVKAESQCGCCNEIGTLRPHIVWFGEMPLEMPKIYNALAQCDLFISIGTSGNVYPAAGFVQEVRRNGRNARTVELNLEPSQGYSLFEERIYGKATEIVPEFVRAVLANVSQL